MRSTWIALACTAAAVAALSNPGAAVAADLGAPLARSRLEAPVKPTPARYRCRRCDDCCDRPHAIAPAYGYYVVPPYAYVPSVVYQGPFGIYRPYPPVVVYDYPIESPYDPPYDARWRDYSRWHDRRW